MNFRNAISRSTLRLIILLSTSFFTFVSFGQNQFEKQASDQQLKFNIQELKGLETILALNGVRFNWKKNGNPDIGLIAQDVEKILPELVEVDANGSKIIRYGLLAAPLIEATKSIHRSCEQNRTDIASHDDRIRRLETLVSNQVQQISELKKRNNALEERLQMVEMVLLK